MVDVRFTVNMENRYQTNAQAVNKLDNVDVSQSLLNHGLTQCHNVTDVDFGGTWPITIRRRITATLDAWVVETFPTEALQRSFLQNAVRGVLNLGAPCSLLESEIEIGDPLCP